MTAPKDGIVYPDEKRFTLDDLNNKTSNSTFTVPGKAGRDFPGANVKKKKNKPPYGPAFPVGGGVFATMDSSLKDGGADVGASDAGGDAGAGGGMGESIEKFTTFIESLRTESNSHELDVIKKGFDVIIGQ